MSISPDGAPPVPVDDPVPEPCQVRRRLVLAPSAEVVLVRHAAGASPVGARRRPDPAPAGRSRRRIRAGEERNAGSVAAAEADERDRPVPGALLVLAEERELARRGPPTRRCAPRRSAPPRPPVRGRRPAARRRRADPCGGSAARPDAPSRRRCSRSRAGRRRTARTSSARCARSPLRCPVVVSSTMRSRCMPPAISSPARKRRIRSSLNACMSMRALSRPHPRLCSRFLPPRRAITRQEA